MLAEYDIFLSHSWADGDLPLQIKAALEAAGLHVWIDKDEIDDFASITRAVTEGLANSKALLAYYSKTYPLRRACQWELTAAFLAAQTEGDPRRRVLVINPESGADHIHPIELRDAKFRNAPNTDGEMQQLVQAIVKHVAQLSGPLADIHPLTAPTWYGMTPVGSTRFVGRLKEMWEVHSLLSASDVTQITGATVNIGQLSGLGGVGKSLLAEEYALHFGAAYPGGVFWLRAYGNDDAKTALGSEEREALRADQMRAMADRLGIDTHGLTAEQIAGTLSRKIASENKPCLWVVDDVPNGLDGDALRRWFAPHALARTLITTRSREYGSLAKGIDLSVLTPDEAFQLLTSRKQPNRDAEKEEARELAKDLGYHALALDVTASALPSSVAAEPFKDFRAKLARPDRDALALAETLADALPNGHEKSIAQTMLRSIRNLGAEGLDFLCLASVLAVAPIPASLVTAVFEEADKLSHEDAEERASLAFNQATSASLAEIAGERQDARSVHRLVSRAVHLPEKSAPERMQVLRASAVEALGAEIAKVARDSRLHKQIELHVAHARQVVVIPETISEANLVGWTAHYDSERGRNASAQTLYERHLEFCRRVLGPEHSDTLQSMNNLALQFWRNGNFGGAHELQEETVAIFRRVLGSEHPRTLVSINNMALIHHARGDLAGARELHAESLAIQRQVLGPDHPDTLTSMNNLAGTLSDQGDLAGARLLEENVLDIVRRVLGPDHPYTLTVINNLAGTISAQGDLAGARKLHEETLEIRRRVLGPEHLDTLDSVNNLAETLREQGDLAEARKLHEGVLDVFRGLLGLEHPRTLTCTNNLAQTMTEQGDLAGARKLHEETLEIRRRVLGPEHLDTLASMNNLAGTLEEQGDLQGAYNLHDQVLTMCRRVLGPEHPYTLSSMNNIAGTLREQRELKRARELEEEALAIRRRVQGAEHPDTLKAMSNLVLTLKAQGDLAGARTLQEETLAVRRRVQGAEHPDTLKAMSNLADTLYALRDLQSARASLEEALAIQRRVLGPEHPDALQSMNNLAMVLLAQGDLAGARDFQRETLELRRGVLGPEHPDTSISAGWLFLTLNNLGEREAARAVLERDLLGLLDRDPVTLGAQQRKIREDVARLSNRYLRAGKKRSFWRRLFGLN